MDQVVAAWQPTSVPEAGAAPAASRRSAWGRHLRAGLRITVLLLIAALAIFVLLPAAIAAQTAFAG